MQPAFGKQLISLIRKAIPYVFLILQVTAQAADLAREQRITEQISDMVLEGEPVHLKNGARQFFGIYQKTERQPVRGTALILHGRGANPDWVDIIHPLRTQLPEYGWNTLAIQLPVASEGASDAEWIAIVPESLPRVAAALAYLKQQGAQNIVVISHSFGTYTAANFLSGKNPKAIKAWVGIGMPSDERFMESNTPALLRRIQIPVLDLFGQEDLVSVTSNAEARRQAARDGGNKAYEQREIAAADHFFSNQDGLLVSIVRGWIAKTASSTTTR